MAEGGGRGQGGTGILEQRGRELAAKWTVASRQASDFVLSAMDAAYHGQSFLYSWWGGCPTNFEVRPTNFIFATPTFVRFCGFWLALK